MAWRAIFARPADRADSRVVDDQGLEFQHGLGDRDAHAGGGRVSGPSRIFPVDAQLGNFEDEDIACSAGDNFLEWVQFDGFRFEGRGVARCAVKGTPWQALASGRLMGGDCSVYVCTMRLITGRRRRVQGGARPWYTGGCSGAQVTTETGSCKGFPDGKARQQRAATAAAAVAVAAVAAAAAAEAAVGGGGDGGLGDGGGVTRRRGQRRGRPHRARVSALVVGEVGRGRGDRRARALHHAQQQQQ